MNYMLNMWDVVMNNKHNPLSQIPDFETRHMVFQLLAWMWCIIFSMYFGSMYIFPQILNYRILTRRKSQLFLMKLKRLRGTPDTMTSSCQVTSIWTQVEIQDM